MRVRTLAFWPLAASLLLHVAALVGGSWAGRSGPAPAPVAPDVWTGRSVFVETLDERGRPGTEPESRVNPAPAPAPAPLAPGPATTRAAAAPDGSGSLTTAQNRKRIPVRREAGSNVDSPASVQGSASHTAQSGAFGAEGLPTGVRRLAVAFTRAVPAATSRDPVWLSLPVGSAGSVRVEIRVNEAGRIVHTRTLESSSVPEHLSRLLDRTLLLLQHGRFAVSGVSAGDAEVFRIDVQVSMKDPTEGFEAGQVVRLGFDPPDARGRGKAFFTLGSGRHVEAAIRVERKRG
jgi:hypothetical protein